MADAVITAAWWNQTVSFYNGQLGTSVGAVTAGQTIENEIFLNARNTWAAAAEASGRTINLPPASHFVDQAIIYKEQWGDVSAAVPATTLSYNDNGSFIVPTGVTKVMVNWLIGGGGGGGTGNEYGNGGGGGGGGGGGFVHWVEIPVRPQDKLTWTIGAGGLGGNVGGAGDGGVAADGKDGGDTILYKNGAEALRVSGGRGGRRSYNNFKDEQDFAPGGIGGTPNGLTGQVGPVGKDDYASSYGGGGAPGPMSQCFGGAGGTTAGGNAYTGASAGKSGVGGGSGGGGGGSDDRSGLKYWAGGSGHAGYLEFTYPSQGPVGGTPAQNNTGYNATAPLTAAAPGGTGGGGGYTGGGGRGGGSVNGIEINSY